MTLTFDGVNLTTAYNAIAFRKETDNSIARNLESVEIAGRTGNYLIDHKRWENLPSSYFLLFANETNFDNCKAFLASKIGYKRLEDSEHTNEFRMARIIDEIKADVVSDRNLFKIELNLDRKPQRFLISGETVTTKTENGSITNPTLFDAKPLLRVYGAGTVGIGSYSLTITQADVYTDIDSEMMDCYKGTTNKNKFVNLTGHKFPILTPGSNGITLGSGITKVEITPRWYTI